MNHTKKIMYALLFIAHTMPMEQSSVWQLHKTFSHASRINSAYFDNNGKIFNEELLITCAPKTQEQVSMFCIASGRKLFTWNPKDDVKTFSLDSTGYLLVWSYASNLTAYLPYSFNAKGPDAIGVFRSPLSIAPHHFSFHKSDTTAGTVARIIQSKWLGIYDMNTNKDICFFTHENPIKDCCFHPFKNIIASITAPDTWIRIIDVDEKKEILTLPSYKTYAYSIRFDGTGKRLALTSKDTVDVLDISNLDDPQTIFSVQNTLNGTQACLNDKYLAVAFPTFIKLFDVETQQEIASFQGNNDFSPMNCFDSTGNFMVVLNGNNAEVYSKTVSAIAGPLAIIPAIPAKTEHYQYQVAEQDADCCCWPILCNQELKKSLASIMVFFQNQMSLFNASSI